MGIQNGCQGVFASVAVRDLNASARWYQALLGRLADEHPAQEILEWRLCRGGRLQVCQRPEQAGSASCSFEVDCVEDVITALRRMHVPVCDPSTGAILIRDPDGNSLAFVSRGTLEPRVAASDHTANTKHSDCVATVLAVYDAYVRKDRAAVEALIAPDFHFSSPLDERIDRATYFERCWPNSAHLDRYQFVHTVAAGDRVFVTYEARTNSAKKIRNTEVLTVRDGQLVEAEVYFGWSIPRDVNKH